MCTPRKKYAPSYWDIVKRNFHRNQNGEVMGCGLKVFPNEIARKVRETLFPEEVRDSGDFEEDYEEDVEGMRHLYSLIMSEDELDIHFPRP